MFPATAYTDRISFIAHAGHSHTAMSFFERFLGISKPTFLATTVIPANPNDAYYDRHCTFCWENYADRHQGVCVLPCIHDFGADSLQNMISSTNGHLYSICRYTLFRPSGKNVSSELLWTLLNSDGLRLRALSGRAIAFAKENLKGSTDTTVSAHG